MQLRPQRDEKAERLYGVGGNVKDTTVRGFHYFGK
jgi:hypothetical protein